MRFYVAKSEGLDGLLLAIFVFEEGPQGLAFPKPICAIAIRDGLPLFTDVVHSMIFRSIDKLLSEQLNGYSQEDLGYRVMQLLMETGLTQDQTEGLLDNIARAINQYEDQRHRAAPVLRRYEPPDFDLSSGEPDPMWN